MGMESQLPSQAALPEEWPGTHGAGGWVRPQGFYGRVLKISTTTGLDPRNFQPKASRVRIPTELWPIVMFLLVLSASRGTRRHSTF
jgi:hypothetical protein